MAICLPIFNWYATYVLLEALNHIFTTKYLDCCSVLYLVLLLKAVQKLKLVQNGMTMLVDETCYSE